MRKLKPVAVGIHLVTMLGCFGLFFLRGVHSFDAEVVIINHEITSHISNFALSYVLCALVGLLLLSAGKRLRSALLFCLAVLVANLVYEAFLPIANTRDMVDALYGFAGSLAGGAYLCWLNAFGFAQ